MSTCSLGNVTKLTQIIKMQGKVRIEYIQMCKLIYQLNNKVNDSERFEDYQCRLDDKL